MHSVKPETMKTDVSCELHISLRVLMRLCRWFGFFPVEGLDKRYISKIKYNMRSFYALYYITTLLSQTYLAGYTIYNCFISDLDLGSMTHLLFHWTGVLSTLLLLNLARKFHKIMKKIANIESRASMVCHKPINAKKYNRITISVMTLALLEHLLSVVYKNKGLKTWNKYSSTHQLPSLRKVLFEVVILQSTFIWNFNDVMTICLSTYLTGLFKNFNDIIENNQKHKIVKCADIRILHTHLVALVKLMDENTCYLNLLSIFTNLFFICAQLFHLMSTIQGLEDFIYYSYSFSFLLIRACVTTFLASNIHTVSKRPLMIIQHVPSAEYDIEVQRLIRQIRYTTTALSGVFFYITRGMILHVIANIVKYELVLVQFARRKYQAINK